MASYTRTYGMEVVAEVSKIFTKKHRDRLHNYVNEEVVPLLDEYGLRLRRRKHFVLMQN